MSKKSYQPQTDYDLFKKALYTLAVDRHDYTTEAYPASVDQIIFGSKHEASILLDYFYVTFGPIKKQTAEFDWIPWKLQDYITFIRSERTKMFPDYICRQHSRKFISNFGWYRSTLLDRYQGYLNGRVNFMGATT